MQTDIVAEMTVRADLAGRDLAERLAIVGVAEENDAVDEVGGRGGDQVGGVVRDLRALAVSRDAELRVRALSHGLLD